MTWLESRGRQVASVTEIAVKVYLDEQKERGHSVPGAVFSALRWFDNAIQMGWPLQDELVLTAVTEAHGAAAATRVQAEPFTQLVMDKLHALFWRTQGAERWITGFFLCLASAVLHWSGSRGMRSTARRTA